MEGRAGEEGRETGMKRGEEEKVERLQVRKGGRRGAVRFNATKALLQRFHTLNLLLCCPLRM